MNYIKKFNDTMCEFMADLITIIPNDANLHLYKAFIVSAIMLDEELVIRGFYNRIYKVYGEHIFAKNEAFFLDHDYCEIVSLHKQNKNIEHIVFSIKTYWKHISDTNREIVWKYFKILCLLSQKWMII